jgi:hypothetical protein
MGWTDKRKDRNGATRYIAKYRDARGRKQSAGTFAAKRDADKAWQAAEVKIAEAGSATPGEAGNRSGGTWRTSGCPTT